MNPLKIPKTIQEEAEISKRDLGTGISISNETLLKIQGCMKLILERTETTGLKFYPSQGDHRVFTLDSSPSLIFKMNKNDRVTVRRDVSTQARYKNMLRAETIIRTHKLGLLVLPRAKPFSVRVNERTYNLIAEQRLAILSDERAHETTIGSEADSLNAAIRQIALFICKTEYSDVEWRNNPVVKNSLDKEGNRKIALVDIEEMDSVEMGLFGGAMRRPGLIGIISEKQGAIVEKVAKENGVDTSWLDHVRARKH